MWDPTSQTYKDGIVPSHHTAMEIDDLLRANRGKLKIFGYGSLCWNPGVDGILSLADIERDELDHDATASKQRGQSEFAGKRKVTTTPGRAVGYQRCWCQRSADHRGTPQFNGIVCTLLSNDEVRNLHHEENTEETSGIRRSIRPSMTEGMIYTVDRDLVEDCLAELDFREKGGYSRDVIDVVEDDTGNTVKALLYRGTPDNPAFWKRVLLDLTLAAATMSAAIGPSGPNDVYLHRLHQFLTHAAQHSSAAARALEDHSGDVSTGELATMVNLLQTKYRPYFLFGAGSNQHNQLLLRSGVEGEGRGWKGMEEAHDMTEMVLVVPRSNREQSTSGGDNNDHTPKSVHAGGGHSALLTIGGDLYLWGWNEAGQLGRASSSLGSTEKTSLLSPIQPLSNIRVESVSLGHTHTLVIERVTGRLFGFGDNGRGQVTGCLDKANGTQDLCHAPRAPVDLSEESFVDIAAGLFHSAAINRQGELITWGCSRFGQCLPSVDRRNGDASSNVGRWHPPDGSTLVKVACGRRHTIVLDNHGRVWTLGDNKYGQLGRSLSGGSKAYEPQLVHGPLGQMDSGCFAIHSGWSHNLALTRNKDSQHITVRGWGRNDKGQLGISSRDCHICIPQNLLKQSIDSHNTLIDGIELSIQSACCGAESSHILDNRGNIYSTGWNEHGNLGIGENIEGVVEEHCPRWKKISSASVVAPPPSRAMKKLFTAGGAHLMVMDV